MGHRLQAGVETPVKNVIAKRSAEGTTEQSATPLGFILWVHLIRGFTPACGLISPSGCVDDIFADNHFSDVSLAVRILREPAFFHSFLLLKQFADAPQGGGSEHSDGGRDECVFDEQGCSDGGQSHNQKHNPGPRAPVVFRLDDDGMPEADCKECANGNDDACEIQRE